MTVVDVLTYVITGDVSKLEGSLEEANTQANKLIKDLNDNFKGLGEDVEAKVEELVMQFTSAAGKIRDIAGKDLTFQEAIDSVQLLGKEFVKLSGDIAPLVKGDIEMFAKSITDSITAMASLSDDEIYYQQALARMAEQQKQVLAERESALFAEKDAQDRAADAAIYRYEREREALEVAAAAEEEKRYREALANAAWQEEAQEILRRRQEQVEAMNAEADAAMHSYDEAKKFREEQELSNQALLTSSERVADVKDKLEELSEKYEKNKEKLEPLVEGTQALSTALNSLQSLAGLDFSFDMIKSLTKDAGNAEKALTRMSAVFKTSVNDAVSASKRIADSYGLSERAAQEMLAYAGQVFTEQGFMVDQALEMAEAFVKRAVDLQSMAQGGQDSAAALKAMVSALISGTKALKSWGVAFTAQDVATEAAIHDLNAYNGKLEGTAKILASYYTILNKTSEAEGNFALNEQNLVNIQQEYNAAVEELRIALGENFLPLMKDMLVLVTNLADFLGEHKWFSSFIAIVLSGAVALKAFSAAAGAGIKAAIGLQTAMKSTETAFRTATIAVNAFNVATGVLALAGILSTIVAIIGAANTATDSAQALSDAVDSMANKGALDKDEVKELNNSWKNFNKDIKNGQQEVADQQEYVNQLHEKELEHLAIYGAAQKELSNARRTNDKASVAFYEARVTAYENIIAAVRELRKEEEATLVADEARVERAENEREAFVLRLSRAYLEAGEEAALLAGLNEELIAEIKTMTEKLKEAQEAGMDLDAYARTLSRSTADWDTLLKNAETHYNNAMKAAEKATGDYNVTMLRNIDLIEKQREEYDKTSRTQLDTIMKLNGFSDMSAKMLQENAAAIVAGDKALDDWADGIEGDTEKIDLQVRYVINAMLSAEKWFNTESAAYRQEFINSTTKDMDKFTEYLTKLTDKTAVTLKDQYTKTLNSGIETFTDAVIAAYGSTGGLTGILSDFLGGEDGKEFPIQAVIEDAVTAVRNGAADVDKVITNLQVKYRMYDLVENTDENKKAVKSFLASLTLALQALMGVEADAMTTYNDAVNKLLVSAQEKQLQAVQDNAKTTLKAKRENEKKLLELEQEADRKSYQQQLGANYDSEEAYKALLAAQEQELQNLNDKWKEEDAEMLRTHKKTMLSLVASTALGAKASYDAQVAILAEEYQYRINHAAQTGEDVKNIYAEWAKQNLIAYRAYTEAVKDETLRLRDIVLETNKRNPNLFTDIFSFANISAIQSNLDIEIEQIVNDGLKKLTGENAQKLNEAFADGKLDIGQMVADNMSTDEMKKALSEFGLAGKEFEAVWALVCKDCAETTDDANKAMVESLTDAVDAMMAYMDKINGLMDSFSDNKKTDIQNKMAEYQKMYDAFSDSLDELNDKNTEGLTKKEKDELERRKKMDEDELARMQSLIDEQEGLLDEQKRKDFNREKAFSIANATISSIEGIVKTLSSTVPPLNYILATAQGAFAAAQIAAIASQPYPSYAVGAYNLPEDQMAQVHKGEMIIPRPFAEELRDNGGIGGDITVNLYGVGDGAEVDESSSEGVRQIDIYVSNKVKTMVARGELDGVLQSRYTLGRNGKRG